MRVEIDIDSEELRELVMDRLAAKLVEVAWEPYSYDDVKDYSQRDAKNQEARKKLIRKINWSKAPQYLSETVVKKFFDKMV